VLPKQATNKEVGKIYDHRMKRGKLERKEETKEREGILQSTKTKKNGREDRTQFKKGGTWGERGLFSTFTTQLGPRGNDDRRRPPGSQKIILVREKGGT